MAVFIDTPEQYEKFKNQQNQVFIDGKRGRKVRVPCTNVALVRRELIIANTYNPNGMPDEKKDALEESIMLAGFSYPVATWWDADLQKLVIVDGFHRWLIAGYEFLGIEYVPIVPLDFLTPEQRMMATWTFNKARGFHAVDLDAELIRKLIEQGVGEDDIAQKLGIDIETVYRYKQVTGIIALFQNAQYSMSWEMKEVAE